MYHPFNKNSSYLRSALLKAYKEKCPYCGTLLQARYMHVDHILPTNKPSNIDDEMALYICELEGKGFILDSIENYLPSCSSCNIQKSNRIFEVSNLRYFHEMALRHTDDVLRFIEEARCKKEYFFEPVDVSLWRLLDFSYQRDISHAIMGYRLTDADVVSCPAFPQVEKSEKQLAIVDYAMIQGETGCGKSISLFQVGYKFRKKGWQVYLLDSSCEVSFVALPDNTEKSLYLIDDAQIYSEGFINNICHQVRPNRKVLFARTVSDLLNPESIILTNADAVNVLYRDFLKRKNEIWPLVKKYDRNIGINMFEIPIEQRIESAKTATTPWQFTYILRGGWRSMNDLYFSISNHRNYDLLVATIAVFQVLYLDKSVVLEKINEMLTVYNLVYQWGDDDLQFLINKKIILSKEDIRIVHLESANLIIALFFGSKNFEKQGILVHIIENEFRNKRISPLGIVWLCNGCGRFLGIHLRAEDIFITESIKETVNDMLGTLQTSEDVRNIMFLLEKIISSDRKDIGGLQIFKNNEQRLVSLINNADSLSAGGFRELFNTLYNSRPSLYNAFSKKINWTGLIKKMMEEELPNYYAWGGLFNRGLSLLRNRRYLVYSDDMYRALEYVISKATICNVVEVTWFVSEVSFLNFNRVHDLMPSLLPIYRDYFVNNMAKAIQIFDFEFLGYICGIDLLQPIKPSEGQKRTADMIIDAIPIDKMAEVIDKSTMKEWLSIRNVLCLVSTYNKEKYKDIIHAVDLDELSNSAKNSWDHGYEICLIVNTLYKADIKIAKSFLKINQCRIKCYFSTMIAIDPQNAIRSYKERNIPLELFTQHWWDDSLAALKALVRIDSEFSKEFLEKNVVQIANRYSDVTALDFSERHSLDLFKLIQDTNEKAFEKIVKLINKEKILEKWDKCGGINPRQKRWICKRKAEFFQLIG